MGLLAAVVAVLVFTHARPAVDVLRAQREAFIAALDAQDAGRLRRLYASDAVFLPFTGQMLSGGERIARGIAAATSRVTVSLDPVAASMARRSRLKSRAWRHTPRDSAAPADSGAYLITWKRTAAGTWVIAAYAVTRRTDEKR